MVARLGIVAAMMIGIAFLPLQGADAPKEAAPEKNVDAFALADALQQRVTLKDEFVNVPLSEVLQFLNEKYELNLIVDPQFGSGAGAMASRKIDDKHLVNLKAVGVPDVLNERITLSKIRNVRLETVLRMICQQVGATYFIYADHISLVSLTQAQTLAGPGAEPGIPEPAPVTFPLITMKVEGKSLSQALTDLASRSNTSILIAPLAAEKAKGIIVAKLQNTPIDQAISLLAEMGELKMVRKGSTYFVTTPEKAKALEPAAIPDAGFNGFCGGLGGPANAFGGVGGGFGNDTLTPLLGMELLKSLKADTSRKQLDEMHAKIAELEKKLSEKK